MLTLIRAPHFSCAVRARARGSTAKYTNSIMTSAGAEAHDLHERSKSLLASGSMVSNSRRSTMDGTAGKDSSRSASTVRVQLQAMNEINAHKGKAKMWQRRAILTGALALVALGAALGVVVFGITITKDAKPTGDAELRTLDGENNVVATANVESFSMLTDLPKMSLEYLEAQDKVTFNDNGGGNVAMVTGFKWFSKSHMTLDLAPEGVENIRRSIEVSRAQAQLL